MALVEEQKQQAEPTLNQEQSSAANLEALSAAVGAVAVAMADLSTAASNSGTDQWDVIKAAADAPAIQAEEVQKAAESEKDEESEKILELVVQEPVVESTAALDQNTEVNALAVIQADGDAEVKKVEDGEKTEELKESEKAENPEETNLDPVVELNAIVDQEAAVDAPAVQAEKVEESKKVEGAEETEKSEELETNLELPVQEPVVEATTEHVQETAVEEPVVEQMAVDKNQEESLNEKVIHLEESDVPPEVPEVTHEVSEVLAQIHEPTAEHTPDDIHVSAEEESMTNEDGESADVEAQDQFADGSSSDIVEHDLSSDHYNNYLEGDAEEISLDSNSNNGDTSSQKIKKKGRVMGGFRSIASGFKDITVGTGRNVTKTSKRAATVGSSTIHKGADGVANAAKSAASGTASGVKVVATGVRDTGVGFAKATAGSVSDIGKVSSKAIIGTRDAVVQGTCIGVGLTVLGAQALGHGAQRTAGAITDGTVGVATSVAHGVKTAGEAVVETAVSAGTAVKTTTTNIVHSVGETIGEVVDTGKAGIRAVEQGIENAAMKSAAVVQRNTVAALTMGLKIADPQSTYVRTPQEALPSTQEALPANEEQSIALP